MGTHMRIFITGGAGFVGSTLTERLVRSGDEVIVLDDLSTGARSNLDGVDPSALTFVEGSILDRELVDELVQGCDRVFHLAAAVGVHNIVNEPLRSLRTNLQGTENVLDACAEARIRVLIASTSEIYGKNDADSLDEEADRIYGSPLRTRWSYAEAKALDEMVAHVYAGQFGLEVVIVRPFNTVGPRQTGRYGMVLPAFVDQALANEPLTVYGDGLQSRCFLHVDDLIEGMVRLLEHPLAVGEPFNLGGPEEITIEGLAKRVIELAGSSSEITHVPYNKAYGEGFEEMLRRVPDTTKARNLVGWEPSYRLDEIIQSVIDHRRSARPGTQPIATS
jgi:UDP-glucose 4-epimerase